MIRRLLYLLCLILGEKTKNWMGVSEMIVSTSICGMLFSLFSGQPLVIIGATGPLLVFEEQMFVVSYKLRTGQSTQEW